MTIGYNWARMGRGTNCARLEKYRFSRWMLQLTQKNPKASCMVSRFLPPPADLTNMFLGAAGIPFPTFLLSSLAGFLPKILTIVYLAKPCLAIVRQPSSRSLLSF